LYIFAARLVLLLTCCFLVSWQDAVVYYPNEPGTSHSFSVRDGSSPALISSAFRVEAAPAETVVPTLSGNNTAAVKSIVDPFELFTPAPSSAICPCDTHQGFQPRSQVQHSCITLIIFPFHCFW
jgi:hypothetical protein